MLLDTDMCDLIPNFWKKDPNWHSINQVFIPDRAFQIEPAEQAHIT